MAWRSAKVHDFHAGIGGLHAITLIFALSALERAPAARCVARCARLLRPGGLLFVRDYAAGDLAQKRLEAKPNRRTAEEDGFVRGEGTLARYFSRADFDALFDADFEALAVGFVERDITNRKQKVTMERRWIQGKYVRRGAPPLFSVGGARTSSRPRRPSGARRSPPPPRRRRRPPAPRTGRPIIGPAPAAASAALSLDENVV